MTEMLVNVIVAIMLQYRNVSNKHIVYLLFTKRPMSIISIKTKKKQKK